MIMNRTKGLRRVWKRTYTAFATVGLARQSHGFCPRSRVPFMLPAAIDNLGGISLVTTTTTTTHQRLFFSSSSDFIPAKPPGTHGTPVYPDVNFSLLPTQNAQARNNDSNAVFVVTGASRGIGLQFVKSLHERTKGTIVACCRTPERATELNTYISSVDNNNNDNNNNGSDRRIHVVSLDVEDQTSIEQAGATIKSQFDRVDLLLNVAGLLGDSQTTPGPERSLAQIERQWMEKSFAVNVIGPVMLVKELSPLLVQRRRVRKQQSESESDSMTHARSPAVVVDLSARVGSISDNGLGGWYSYRMSKSALNQATKTMALELKRSNAWAIAVHPGTTNTDLSKPFQANVKEGSLFPVEFTVQQLLNIVDSIGEEHSGGFYDWAGQALSY